MSSSAAAGSSTCSRSIRSRSRSRRSQPATTRFRAVRLCRERPSEISTSRSSAAVSGCNLASSAVARDLRIFSSRGLISTLALSDRTRSVGRALPRLPRASPSSGVTAALIRRGGSPYWRFVRIAEGPAAIDRGMRSGSSQARTGRQRPCLPRFPAFRSSLPGVAYLPASEAPTKSLQQVSTAGSTSPAWANSAQQPSNERSRVEPVVHSLSSPEGEERPGRAPSVEGPIRAGAGDACSGQADPRHLGGIA